MRRERRRSGPAGGVPVTDPSATRRRGRRQRLAQRYGALASSSRFRVQRRRDPYFLTFQTLVNTELQQAAPIAIVAIGMALVISTGGIDLSVRSVIAIAARSAR